MNEDRKAGKSAVVYLFNSCFDAGSIERQREACTERARELGATIVQEYVEYGPLGRSINERPILQRMLEELTQRDIRYVIAYDHGQVSLTMHAYGSIVWKIEEAQAELVIASVPYSEYQQLNKSASPLATALIDESDKRCDCGKR